MGFDIADRRWSDLLDTLRQTGPDPQYLSRIPYEARQLAEARSQAQAGAEVESRNRITRNVEALGAGVSLLSSPDAGPDEVRYLRQLEAAKQRDANEKAMQERVDIYGTPYSYEARNRQAEGGVYRDDASVNRMLRHDPAALVGELESQQAQAAPVEPSGGDTGGTFSVIPSGRPSDEARAQRLAEILGLARESATTKADRDARRAAKVPKEERARQFFAAEQEASRAAEVQGVDTVIAAIRERAAQDADTAAIAGKLIASLKNRRLKDKDLERETLGDGTVFGPDGELLGGRLPAHRGQAALLQQLRPLSPKDQAAAERGYW